MLDFCRKGSKKDERFCFTNEKKRSKIKVSKNCNFRFFSNYLYF